jgi:hypothetical protein
MKRTAATVLALVLGCPFAWADGGTVCHVEQVAGYRVTVFAAPAPLRAGPVDVSVMVQDAQTHAPLAEVEIEVRLTGPFGAEVRCPATRAAATNRLLHAAKFELPTAGTWQTEIRLDGPHGAAELHFPLTVAEPLPRWVALWPWIVWPVVPVVLFCLHQVFTRRKSIVQPSSPLTRSDPSTKVD